MLNIIRKAWRPYATCLRTDAAVAARDPLGLDSFFEKEFIDLNTLGSVEAFKLVCQSQIPPSSTLANLDFHDALAATRDLGMIASSMVRHGLARIPEVEESLLVLARTTHEVPADTVFTYGPRNPFGSRRRRFTSDPREEVFINSFSSGMRKLLSAVAFLEAAQTMDPADPQFARFIRHAAKKFTGMVDAMLKVRQSVSPEFFTNVMRPYFEPKVIGDKKYLAAGGAQMPVILLDLILWGVDSSNRMYLRYWSENLEYHPEALRQKVRTIFDRRSIVSILLQASEKESLDFETRENLIMSLAAAIEMLGAILKFRYPHLRTAEANMKIRPAQAVGSGGYNTVILEFLIDKTQSAAHQLRERKATLEASR